MDGLIIDGFAGGGGASEGIRRAIGRSPDICVNHDAGAIAMHEANHPDSLHLVEDIWHARMLDLVQGQRVALHRQLGRAGVCRGVGKGELGRTVRDGGDVNMAIITKRIIRDLHETQDYLRRWSLWLPLGWSVKLHHIVRPDDDRCQHDHPWSFLRIILWGGYLEECGDSSHLVHRKPWRPWAPWRLYWCGRSFRHRIVDLPRGSSWTLVICTRHLGTWGFFTRSGWVHWRAFVNEAWAKRVLWCDDGRVLDNGVEHAPMEVH